MVPANKLERAAEVYATGIEAAHRIAADHPRIADLEADYGRVLLELKRLDEARAVARVLADRYTRHPTWPAYGTDLALWLLADCVEVSERREVFVRWSQDIRERRVASPTARAQRLARFATSVLEHGQTDVLAEAEAAARACVQIRTKVMPGHWLRRNAESLLGGVLLARNELEEAEPLLVESAEGMLTDPSMPSPEMTADIDMVAKAVGRVVRLYEARHALEPEAGHDRKAAAWRTRLEER